MVVREGTRPIDAERKPEIRPRRQGPPRQIDVPGSNTPMISMGRSLYDSDVPMTAALLPSARCQKPRETSATGGADGPVIALGDRAAERGSDAKERDHVGRHADGLHALRTGRRREIAPACPIETDGGHGLRVVREIDVLRGREAPHRVRTDTRHEVLEPNQPIRLGIWQRPEHDAIDDREHGGTCGHSERERRHGDRRERRSAAQASEGQRRIAHPTGQPGPHGVASLVRPRAREP